MDYWEFRRSVHARGGNAALDEDFYVVETIISEMYVRGWTASDTASYIKATEYGSPDLDEDVGLARMAALELKYAR